MLLYRSFTVHRKIPETRSRGPLHIQDWPRETFHDMAIVRPWITSLVVRPNDDAYRFPFSVTVWVVSGTVPRDRDLTGGHTLSGAGDTCRGKRLFTGVNDERKQVRIFFLQDGIIEARIKSVKVNKQIPWGRGLRCHSQRPHVWSRVMNKGGYRVNKRRTVLNDLIYP